MANASSLVGAAIPAAASPDPSLCRISGYLINGHGQPLKGWALVIRYVYCPLGNVSDSSLVLQERLTVKSDRAGYVEFDLIRGADVQVELPNLLFDLPADLRSVPDASSCELVAFLFPYIISVDWTDPDPRNIEVGETLTAEVTATLSNGDTMVLLSSLATISNSNDAVLLNSEGPYYRGLTAGTSELTLDAVDISSLELHTDTQGNVLTFLGVPSPTIAADPLEVTVS